MKKSQFDVVVVGSGPAGVHAAYPLIKAGLRVVMIDGGLDNLGKKTKPSSLATNREKTSHAFDLIKESSSTFEKTYDLLKIKSNIEIVQSLAKGGLSQTWHGICDFFSEAELEAIGLPPDEIKREYKEISKLIKLQFGTPLDLHSRLLLAKAKNNAQRKNSLYQVPLVFSYHTSNFVEELKRFKNFIYVPNQLVYVVKENRNQVEIKSFSIDKKIEIITKASFLILAAGSINTTRILLRSFNLYDYKTSFLTKCNYIVPCLHLASLGKKNNSKGSMFGQIVISGKGIDHNVDSFYIQLYRLNTLFLDKALQYINLPKILALSLLSAFAPFIVIADIRFPAFRSELAFCKLEKSGRNDILKISFKETTQQLVRHKKEYGKIRQQLWSLSLFPLRTIIGYTTSHYAGGVSFKYPDEDLSVDKNGKLHGTNKIYVADTSSWKILPAKPPTMTIMANAARVGKNVLKRISLR